MNYVQDDVMVNPIIDESELSVKYTPCPTFFPNDHDISVFKMITEGMVRSMSRETHDQLFPYINAAFGSPIIENSTQGEKTKEMWESVRSVMRSCDNKLKRLEYERLHSHASDTVLEEETSVFDLRTSSAFSNEPLDVKCINVTTESGTH